MRERERESMEGGTAVSAPTPATTSAFSMRIVTLDYYMARPIPELDACYSPLLGQPIAEVPVVRIFGTTLTGQKTCLHLHKVFPYFYVPYEEDLPEDVTCALAFVRSLALAIEKALKLATNVGAKRQHVYCCSLVRGKKFYGYHVQEQLFVKIVLYYPQEVPRLSGLLLGGGILNRRFQPYESHIPFLLQVMVDHNLSGMGHVHLSDIRFRQPVLENQFAQICTSTSKLNSVVSLLASSESLTAGTQSLTGSFMELWCRKVDRGEEAQNILPDKQSTCELEGDTCVEAILNQCDLSYIPLEKAGPEIKMVQSLIPIWDELNVTGKMDATVKERNVPSQNYGQAARYEKDFEKMFERFFEVHEGLTMDSDADEPSMANVEEDLSISEDDTVFKSNALLLCTQAAYSKTNMLRTYRNENELRSLSMGSGEKDEKETALVDENIIRHQLTQSSQDTDEEAVELLKWMISSQQDDILTGYSSDLEKVDDETSWSQVFQCADEALAKVISDYELSSQQECQAIIDCLEENAEAGKIGECDGSRHRIPQFDGSCDEEMSYSKVTRAKSEGENTLLGEEREVSKADRTSLNNMDSLAHRGRYQKKGWGPLSAKRSSQHPILNNDPKLVVGVFNSHKEDVVRTPDRELKEESETAFRLSEHSVRDLMRSKRIRRQQTHLMATEGSAPVITTANRDKSSTVIRGSVEDGRNCAALVCSTDSLEKKPEWLDHSSKFGPLPLVKSGLSANRSRGFISAEEEFGREECRSVLRELGTEECSPSSKTDLSSLQGSEMLCCAGVVERDACKVARLAGDEINNSLDRKKRGEGIALSNPNPEPVFHSEIETCLCSSMKGSEFTLAFWKKPPTAEHLLMTFKSYSLPSVDHGEVFYGKPEDLPDKPAVMAGMLFKVRSQDVHHLSQYQFAKDVSGGFLTSSYVSANLWTPSMEDDSAVLPLHFHNDGTVLFLLSPVKLPPTVADVCAWIGQRQLCKDDFQQIEMVCEQIGNCAGDSQGSFTEIDDESQPSQAFKPSSPKYDETFMLPFSLDEVTRTMFPESNCQSFQQTKAEIDSAEQSLSSSKSKFGTGTGLTEGSASKRKSHGGALAQEQGNRGDVSQISGPTVAENLFTPISQAGFRDPASTGRGQQISVISVEAFASTRGDLRPDPRYDSIKCITMILEDDIYDSQLPGSHTIALLCDEEHEGSIRNRDALIDCEIVTLKDEASLLRMFVWFVRMYDPDILLGWEIQGFSLGLLAERAANLGLGLLREISRLPESRTFPHAMQSSSGKETEPKQFGNFRDGRVVESSIVDDEWGRTHGSGIHVGGRIVLNLWRIMRGEIKLGIYTLEAVAEAVLKRKIPSISWRTLTQWFLSGSGRKRHLCIEYCINRARLNLQIMDQLDLVNRTSELARVFGIDFFSVLSRGSQYRVESMMLRVAHSQNYLLISPSRQQVAAQPAMQCLPLVMEPESRFYTDPVVVLDFQSLYPSMMIAYNLCFSTCLGKVVPDNPKVLGVTSLNLDLKSLKELKDCLTFTPNGVIFASPKARPGVLPRLLDEILSTRIMVKQSMKKLLPTQKVLERVLNARQLALKLISNVTYGYTAAGFSGRMPCAELADSIVQFGRSTLECAINFVNTNTKWNARVIYGDTDSMFVLLKGCTRSEAFKIGAEIAEAITELNPHPVTLKMEKVYHPCVLLTKKRYVGYSYESPMQTTPKFDAKGIETVRRDSCGAVAKTLEKSLRILFESHDISQVKSYLQRQWGKIMNGRISLKDFIFAKEVRLGSYSARASVLPPAAIVANKAMSIDPRAEPQYGERVPYLVVHGEPGARLVDMVVDPYVLVNTSSAFRLHDIYYITKQIIPALQRVFGLIGVDLSAWYNDLPRVSRPPSTKRSVPVFPFSRYSKQLNVGVEKDGAQIKLLSTRTIDHYYLSQHCMICGDLIQASSFICESCSVSTEIVGTSLLGRSSCLERRFKHLLAICRHCGGGDEKDMEEGLSCISLACSVFYERIKVQKECRAAIAATNQCGFMWPQ